MHVHKTADLYGDVNFRIRHWLRYNDEFGRSEVEFLLRETAKTKTQLVIEFRARWPEHLRQTEERATSFHGIQLRHHIILDQNPNGEELTTNV